MRKEKNSIPFRGGFSRQGFALLVVLLLLVLLELIVAELAISSWLSLKAARNFSRDLQTVAAVDGVLRAAGEALSSDDLSETDRYRLIQEGIQDLALEEATVNVTIEDENGKLNLNLLTEADPELARMAREELARLLDALGKETELAEGIAELILGDSVEPGEEAAVVKISMLEELLSVEGMSKELLLGRAGDEDSEARALANYLTCWGDGLVNINTASREVLQAVIGEFRPDVVETILRERESKPFESVQELEGLVELSEEEEKRLRKRLTTESTTYFLTINSRAGDLSAVTEAVLDTGPRGAGTVRFCRRIR